MFKHSYTNAKSLFLKTYANNNTDIPFTSILNQHVKNHQQDYINITTNELNDNINEIIDEYLYTQAKKVWYKIILLTNYPNILCQK